MKKQEAPYQCHYCHKKFQREANFIRHKCKMMLKEEKLRTPLGQAAWQYYQDWMRLQKRRVPDDRAFLKSNYYHSFNRFAEFVKKLNLPSPQTFVKLMIQNDYPPTMWTRDEVYAIYMEHLDRNVSPKELAEITTKTLADIADAADCEIGEIFDVLTGSEVIELVRQRKLSPWILLPSKKFHQFFIKVSEQNKEQGIVLESIIRTRYWTARFQKMPQALELMKKVIAGLDL